MKILHVVQGYHPMVGGTEWFIQQLSERLVRDYGDEVTVYTTTAAKNCEVFWHKHGATLPAGVEIMNRVTVRRFPIFNKWGRARHLISQFADNLALPYRDRLRALFNGPLILNMTQAIANHPATVIMASSFPFLHMHYALWGGQRSQTPVALFGAIHPTAPWSFDRPMMYQAIKQAKAYIANTAYEKTYLVERGIPAKSIQPIGPGVDLADFAQADGKSLRQTLGWKTNPVIGYIGHLAKRKRVAHLLTAMPLVWATYPQAKLLLAGVISEDYRAELAQTVERFNQVEPNRVMLKQNFSQSEKPHIFAACDILVSPSTQESFGIVFLEAWACRKPIIGMNVAAIPSIITHEQNGLLVEPNSVEGLAQAICGLIHNQDLRHNLGEAGYHKVAQHHTWEIVTAKFRRVYQGMI